MEFLKALIAMWLFAVLMSALTAKGDVSPISNDTQCICLAIVAAGALAHTEK